MGKKIKIGIGKVTLFLNGKVTVIDKTGNPIPELEGRYDGDLHKKLISFADTDTIWENFPEGFNPVIEESHIRRFEYLAKMVIEADTHEELTEKLNELGKEGWELIQFEKLIIMGVVKVRLLNPIFKREVY